MAYNSKRYQLKKKIVKGNYVALHDWVIMDGGPKGFWQSRMRSKEQNNYKIWAIH